MDILIQKLLVDFKMGSLPAKEDVSELIEKIDFDIDKDYLDFIKTYNGGEGFVGEEFLSLWFISDIIKMNPYYKEDTYAKSIFFFGSNGGDAGYGFRKSDGVVFEVPYIDMSQECSIMLGSNFKEFLISLSKNG